MGKPANLYTHDVEIYKNYFCVTILNRLDKSVLTFRIGDLGDGVVYNDIMPLVAFYKDPRKYMIGFNSMKFDDPLINWIIANADDLAFDRAGTIARAIYDQSQAIINASKNNLPIPHMWDKNFNTIDTMRLGKKGNQRKALKLMAVNLKWPLIQDLPYRWDKPIDAIKEEKLLKYNLNDIGMTDEMYERFRDDIRLRRFIHKIYGINVLSDPDSVIADRLLLNMYASAASVDRRYLQTMRTERPFVSFHECISDKVKFRTSMMQQFLKTMRLTTVHSKQKFAERVCIGNTHYDIKQGGLHSAREGQIFICGDDEEIIDADVESYYPNLMRKYGIYPAHLGSILLDVLGQVIDTRVDKKREYKLTGSEQAKLFADSLKITINATFGKMGFEHSWLYDPRAMYSVTLNGQLFLLMLVERLQQAGIEVFYANTDGITAKVPKALKATYYKICKAWEKYTNLVLEYDDSYHKCIIQDVNNYLIIKKPDEEGEVKTKAKGRLDPDAWKDISNKKAFVRPVVPRALYEYWVSDIPVRKTIEGTKDLHDFCMAQKVGDTYHDLWYEVYDYDKQESIIHKGMQRTSRYFVVNSPRDGGVLTKIKYETDSKGKIKKPLQVKSKGGRTNICSGELIYLANDLRQHPDVEPKYTWYIKECNKIIRSLEGQMNLFT